MVFPSMKMATAKQKAWIGLLILGSLLLMAGLDYVTGQEIVFSAAYLVPVALTAWWFGRRWTVAMAAVSGAAALAVDLLDGLEYAHPGIEYWNAGTCFAISCVTGYVLGRLRQSLRERELMNERLCDALDKLRESTAEIRELQSGLQTVCAWTKRIKVGEEWMSPEEFLKTQLHLQLTHGISPEAVAEIRKQTKTQAA